MRGTFYCLLRGISPAQVGAEIVSVPIAATWSPSANKNLFSTYFSAIWVFPDSPLSIPILPLWPHLLMGTGTRGNPYCSQMSAVWIYSWGREMFWIASGVWVGMTDMQA